MTLLLEAGLSQTVDLDLALFLPSMHLVGTARARHKERMRYFVTCTEYSNIWNGRRSLASLHLLRCELSSKIRALQSQLQSELLMEDYQKVTKLSYAAAEDTHAKAKLNQTKKLGKLMDMRDKHHGLRPQGLERWVVNLTDRSLSKPQEDVLRLGLNFAPAPTKLPVVDTIAAVEEGARQLSEEDAEDLRGRVCGILRHAKPPKDNLTKEQRKALKELRSLEDEVILPADKGNATVRITREDYDRKMRGMLDTATYKRLKKDPTATQEGKLSQRLKGLEKDGEITGQLYHQLRPSGS